MKEEDFYKNFNSNNVKVNHFTKSFFIPFTSGILGTILILGISFGVPNIRNKLFNFGNTSNKKDLDGTIQTNNEILDTVSISNYSDTAIAAARKVLPSIVGINVNYTVTSNIRPGLSQEASASGSGIIISSDGYILTNNHIINSTDSSSYYTVSEATSVSVYLYNDNTPYEATIIGTDSETDLAVIKVDKTDLIAAELGNSETAKVGEFVLAIGTPLGLQSSVTSGIISAVNREVTDSDGKKYTLIQTDAAINSGNSGGALVNAEGKVIGINTLKLSGSGIEGMGFAIPINNTTDIYAQLIEKGKVVRPYIGITGVNLTENLSKQYNLPIGIYVKNVASGSPADLADVKQGDVITSIDETEVSTMEDLNNIKNQKNIGDTIKLKIYRDKKTIEINITLVEE